MAKETKFCANCGTEQSKESKFCTNCGYDFETKSAPNTHKSNSVMDQATKTFTSAKETVTSKIDMDKVKNNQSLKKILSGKIVLGSLAVLAIVLVVYFFVGGVDVAGKYESEYTIGDPLENNRLEISNRGKATLINDSSEGYMEVSFQLQEDDLTDYYIVDSSENATIELRIPKSELYNNFTGNEFDYFINALDLKQKEEDDKIVVTGEITAVEAVMFDMDYASMSVSSHQNERDVLLDGDVYIKE
ncbi:zinc-ribbon domain-containing protein [Lacticigenium naphthae]|uniref:zinc-ribbon domain-containing protein n=1 Tax=Lacticigenium naphthae TaxID=515351 RepID=UPI0003F6365B|nr:zinc ribbon domain-containing protein [Lacticigenium naphthae]